jgi:hypothetical protein
MGQMGMWDGPNIEGPSCIRLPPLALCTLEDLETLYVQAKNTYFSGQPVVDDAMFDQIEKRLVRVCPALPSACCVCRASSRHNSGEAGACGLANSFSFFRLERHNDASLTRAPCPLSPPLPRA